MRAETQLCRVRLVDLFDGLAATSLPVGVVRAVQGVVLFHALLAGQPLGGHAHRPRGEEFPAGVPQLDPGDRDVLGPAESSFAGLWCVNVSVKIVRVHIASYKHEKMIVMNLF